MLTILARLQVKPTTRIGTPASAGGRSRTMLPYKRGGPAKLVLILKAKWNQGPLGVALGGEAVAAAAAGLRRRSPKSAKRSYFFSHGVYMNPRTFRVCRAIWSQPSTSFKSGAS